MAATVKKRKETWMLSLRILMVSDCNLDLDLVLEFDQHHPWIKTNFTYYAHKWCMLVYCTVHYTSCTLNWRWTNILIAVLQQIGNMSNFKKRAENFQSSIMRMQIPRQSSLHCQQFGLLSWVGSCSRSSRTVWLGNTRLLNSTATVIGDRWQVTGDK